MGSNEGGLKDYDPLTRPKSPLEGIRRAIRKAGVGGGLQAGDLTGRLGYDPVTGLPIAETSNQPIQATRDRLTPPKTDAGKK